MKNERVLKFFSKITLILMVLVFFSVPSAVLAYDWTLGGEINLTADEIADAETFCAVAGADCITAEDACTADPVACKANIESARSQCNLAGAFCEQAKAYCRNPDNADTCKNALVSGDPAGAMMGILTGGGSSGGSGGSGPLGIGFGTITGGAGGADGTGGNAPAAPKGPPPETISVFGQIADKVGCIRDGSCKSLDDILGAFAIVAQWILGITGSVVLLMFVWGGAEWVYSAGNSKTVQSGKDKMKYAVMGLTLVFASLAIVRTISAGLGVTAIQCISDQECKADAPYCLAGKCSKTKDTPISKTTTTPSTQPTSSQPVNARGDECAVDDDCTRSGKGYVCFNGQSKNVCVSACLYVNDETKCLASKEDNVSCMWDGPSHQCFKPAAYLGTYGAPCVGNSQSGTCGSGMTCVYSRPIANTGTGLPTYVCTTGEADSPCNDVAFAPEPNGGCKTGLTCVSKRCEAVETCHTTADCSTVGYSCVGGGVIFSGTCKKDCSGISGAACKHSPAYNICPNGGQWVTSAACPNDGDICCL